MMHPGPSRIILSLRKKRFYAGEAIIQTEVRPSGEACANGSLPQDCNAADFLSEDPILPEGRFSRGPSHNVFESFNDFFLFPLSLVVQFIPRKIIRDILYAQWSRFDANSLHFLPG